MVEVIVTVEVDVNPTEDEDKVRAAVNNVLGNAKITMAPAAKGSLLTATAKGQDSLIKLRNMFRGVL